MKQARTRRIVRAVLAPLAAFGFVSQPGPSGAQASAEIAVAPAFDLVDGQAVTVTGTGWPASEPLPVAQCVRVALVVTCEIRVVVEPDATGAFTTPVVVRQFVGGNDCRANFCFIGAEVPDEFVAFEGITFIGGRPDLILHRRSDGAQFFADEYFADVFEPVRSHAISAGGKWTYALRIQNDGPLVDDLVVRLKRFEGFPPFSVRVFVGYFDVTAAALDEGIVFDDLAPGETRSFAVQFRAVGAAAGQEARVRVSAWTAPIENKRDNVGLRVFTPAA